jgi:RES domain-containing protein
MAESVSLAVLKNLVHMSKEDFPNLTSTHLGDRWIDSLTSAVLRVRSAVVPTEYTYLLNPKHHDFDEIAIDQPFPYVFDERLFRVKKLR